MKNDIKSGNWECFSVVTVCIITKMFYGFLPFQAKNYGASLWYINIISALLMFLSFWLAVRAGGFGKFSNFAVFMYFMFYTAMNLRETVRVIKIYNFSETPEWIFLSAFLFTAALIAKRDIFAGVKLAGLYSKLIIGAFIVIFLLGLNQYSFVNLMPAGGYGFLRNAEGCVTQLTVFSDVFMLIFLLLRSGNNKNAVRSGAGAMLAGAVITAVSAICYICVYDYSVVGDKSSGILEVVRNAYYGHLLQRMESVFFLVMIISSAISVCVWLSYLAGMYSASFGIEDKGEIVIPLAVTLLALTLSGCEELFAFAGRCGGIFLIGVSAVSYLTRRRI